MAEAIQDKQEELVQTATRTYTMDEFVALPKEEVKAMYEREEIDGWQAKDYITLNLLEKGPGLLGLKEDQARYAYERGFITPFMGKLYKQYQSVRGDALEAQEKIDRINTDGYPSLWSEFKNRVTGLVGFTDKGELESKVRNFQKQKTEAEHVLKALANGYDLKQYREEMRGLDAPLLDPTDLIADIMTGGLYGLAKAGGKGVARSVGKEAAKDAGLSLTAMTAMETASQLGAGGAVEMLSGLITPMGVAVLFGMGGRKARAWYRALRQNNPEVADQVEGIARAFPEGNLRSIIEEAEEIRAVDNEPKTVKQTVTDYVDETIEEPIPETPRLFDGEAVAGTYNKLKSDSGYSNVPIADLRDALGVSQDEMAELLKELGRKGKAVVTKGDWSLSDDHLRSGAVKIRDHTYLLVKLNKGAKEAIDELYPKGQGGTRTKTIRKAVQKEVELEQAEGPVAHKTPDITEGSTKAEPENVQSRASERVETPTEGVVKPGNNTTQVRAIVKALRSGETGGEKSRLAELMEKAGSEDSAEILDAVTEQFAKEIDKARGGPLKTRKGGHKSRKTMKGMNQQAHAEIRKLSETTGFEENRLKAALGFMQGEAEKMKNAYARARAANLIFTKYADEVYEMATKGQRTFEEELRVLEHIRILAEMQQSIYQIRAEFGRGLKAYDLPWKKSRFDFSSIPVEELNALKKSDQVKVRRAIDHFKKGKGDTQKLLLRARNIDRSGFLLGLLELQQAAMLSHPVTQMRNLIGNTIGASIRQITRRASTNIVAYTKAKGLFARDGLIMQRNHFQNVALKTGLINAFRVPSVATGKLSGSLLNAARHPIRFAKGTRLEEAGTFWRALWTGQAQLDSAEVGKLETQHAGIIPDDVGDIPFFGKKIRDRVGEEGIFIPKALKLPIGKIIRLPFHALTAGDELFKSIGYWSEVYDQSFRAALKDPDINMQNLEIDVTDRIRSLGEAGKGNPELHMAGIREARYDTYTSDLDQITELGNKFLNTPVIGPLVRLTGIPFYRVLVNLTKFSLQQTPLGLAAKWQREVMKNGDWLQKTELMSRWAMGLGTLGVAAALYESEMLTGKLDESNYYTQRDAGASEYSMVLPDGQLISYKEIEPLALLVGTAANISRAYDLVEEYQLGNDAEQELEEVIMGFLTAFADPIQENTFAQSVKDLTLLVTDPERMNTQRWTTEQIAKFYPRLIDFAMELADRKDIMREARDPLEAWYAKWGSVMAKPKRHIIYGNVIEREPRFLGILNQRELKDDDPVMMELLRLGVDVRPFQDEMSYANGQQVELDKDQIEEIWENLAELPVKEHLTAYVQSSGYQEIGSDVEKANQLKRLIQMFRSAAKGKFKGENEDFCEAGQCKLERELDAIAGYEQSYNAEAKVNYWLNQFIDE